ncbi:class A beta-lactamase [Fimbriimonas ginsengisoli]|uniref:Beta-lactamase class A n=1 Tax=Fimbriimonas ginsengisoli Gsoil 348 TaxID=661478 RepID=A0A068NK12_FIMGI|nr:class A beta-lactamase [Fimbriimonas ginsengisoli]AIE83851.1 beta-lactamase class A [Fimbriimonas ginsengisoli Gsoil 348]
MSIVPLFFGLLLKSQALDVQLIRGRVQALEAGLRHGSIGVAVTDLRTGESWAYHGDSRFPMQSVFKLPLGIAVLDAVDRREHSLDTRIMVGWQHLSVPMSVINDRFSGHARPYSVAELLELAVGVSDNTAADLLLSMMGGPQKVTARLKRMGINGIRVDRFERQLQVENVGLPGFNPELTSEGGFLKALSRVPGDRAEAAMKKYLADPRDTATPNGMVDLLAGLQRGRFLSPASRERLLRIMTASTTGPNRLKAGLPKGSTLAHKTGTGREILGICGAINDVGIATLPGGRKLAIAVFLSGTSGTKTTRERIIANVARAVTDSTGRI